LKNQLFINISHFIFDRTHRILQDDVFSVAKRSRMSDTPAERSPLLAKEGNKGRFLLVPNTSTGPQKKQNSEL
jgi:hypothetical protein